MMRLVALISLTTGTVINYSLGPYQGKQTGESSLFSQLLNSLSIGDLLMAIVTIVLLRLLPCYRLWECLFCFKSMPTKSGFSTRSTVRRKDHGIEWKKPKRKPVWMTAQAYADLPNTLIVREFAVKGVVYVTTLLKREKHPKTAVAAFYRERWKIELDFRTIKTHIGMELLRCKSPDSVEKRDSGVCVGLQYHPRNLAQAAMLHDKIPRQLSFRSAVQLVIPAASN